VLRHVSGMSVECMEHETETNEIFNIKVKENHHDDEIHIS